MKAYYDGSVGADENGDQWITLAAISGTDEVWAQFDERWAKMLKNRYPIAPYIHMIEVLDDKDPFESLVGWDQSRKEALIQDAVVLLSQMNKAGFSMAWSAINESARLRLISQGMEEVIADPYAKCAAECSMMAVGGYLYNVPDEHLEPVYIFYDRGESYLGSFKNRWLKERTKPGNPKPTTRNNWDFFRDVQEVDLPCHFGLQAADMVAWANSRALQEKERPFHYLKEWLIKVVPSQSIEHTEELLCHPDRNRNSVWQRIFYK